MAVRIHMHAGVEPGSLVVVAFPSIGLVATIAANHLIEELALEQVGVVDGPTFPTISVVERGEPLNPVRIYAGRAGEKPIVVVLSEFQPSPALVRPVSEALLAWSKEAGCQAIVTPEGLLLDEEGDGSAVFGAASTPAMRQRVEQAGAPMFKEGIVAGVTGVLLNLGMRDRFPVAAVLVEARQGQPDGRSAVHVVRFVAALAGATIDTAGLHREADAFDAHVGDVQRRLRLQEGEGTPTAGMYG